MSRKQAHRQAPRHFDDHLDLEAIAFGERCTIIFHGASGSGKSTCIAHLLERHPGFRGQPHAKITGGPIEWNHVRPVKERLVVIDELLTLTDMWHLGRLMQSGHVVIAASHLPPWLTGLFGVIWPLRQFATDRDERKITRFFQRQKITCSPQTVSEFCKKFGATYTDAEIILDHTGGSDFDLAYRRFTQLCSIERVRPHRAWFSGPCLRSCIGTPAARRDRYSGMHDAP